MGWDVNSKQISGSFECCCSACFYFFIILEAGKLYCAFILWSLFPHTCFFTAFIAFCLMELLSWKKHKPAENQKCFLLSAKGQVRALTMLAVCDWDDADQFGEDFCWHQAGVVGMSHCPAPHTSLLLSSWREEERRGEGHLGLPCTLLFPAGRIEGASGSHL